MEAVRAYVPMAHPAPLFGSRSAAAELGGGGRAGGRGGSDFFAQFQREHGRGAQQDRAKQRSRAAWRMPAAAWREQQSNHRQPAVARVRRQEPSPGPARQQQQRPQPQPQRRRRQQQRRPPQQRQQQKQPDQKQHAQSAESFDPEPERAQRLRELHASRAYGAARRQSALPPSTHPPTTTPKPNSCAILHPQSSLLTLCGWRSTRPRRGEEPGGVSNARYPRLRTGGSRRPAASQPFPPPRCPAAATAGLLAAGPRGSELPGARRRAQ